MQCRLHILGVDVPQARWLCLEPGARYVWSGQLLPSLGHSGVCTLCVAVVVCVCVGTFWWMLWSMCV